MEAEIKALYLRKAADYCATREHCQFDVLRKLKEWKVEDEIADEILAQLISMGFVDDLRFAEAYVRGKRRINGWGRIKIKQGLILKQISAPCIKTAIEQIDSEEYIEDLLNQFNTLWSQHEKKKTGIKLKAAVLATLQQRGFESSLIYPLLDHK